MVDAPVVPDRQVILGLPPQTDLQVVVLDDESYEPVQQRTALRLRQSVNTLHVVAHGEYAAPPRHGVCPDHRVDGLEHLSDVLGGAAGFAVDGEVVARGGLVEKWLCVVRRQAVEEFPNRGRDTVI